MEASPWALPAAAQDLVLDEIDRGRELIVECGSGESTVAIARRLSERGAGRLFSLEHDPGWFAQTRVRLEAEGVADRVELVLAPLRDGWYDRAEVKRLPVGIELLLVDGPPGDLDPAGEVRYPALPALAQKLAPGALVLLDDVHRPGEQRVARRWGGEFGIRLSRRGVERFAIGVFSEPAHAGKGAGADLREER